MTVTQSDHRQSGDDQSGIGQSEDDCRGAGRAVVDRATDRAADRAGTANSDAHLLRLCLDLQLDALLLTLGAAAAQERAARTQPHRGATGWLDASADPPWRRWAEEDVNLACELAADALDGGAALPSTLGSDPHRLAPAATVDNLAARFESMRTLLRELTERRSAHPRLHAALRRCRCRLGELHGDQLISSPPRELPQPQAGRHYLPGELLG